MVGLASVTGISVSWPGFCSWSGTLLVHRWTSFAAFFAVTGWSKTTKTELVAERRLPEYGNTSTMPGSPIVGR